VKASFTDGGSVTATRHFTIPTFTFEETSPVAHTYEFNTDWTPPNTEAAGETTAVVQPVGGIVIPPSPVPSSTSGCDPSDFNGFVPGRVALIQRGTCNFGVKVLNAEAVGASGVVIFDEGNPGRTGLFGGQLADANGFPITPTIPVAFTTFAVGSDLYDQFNQAVQDDTGLPTVHLKV